jgi:hypothetical protein
LVIDRDYDQGKSQALLIYRNVGWAVVDDYLQASCLVRWAAGINLRIKQTTEGSMTPEMHAFIFTGEVFCLSFVAIVLVWFADRLRSGFLGRP